jgi:formylmethanofuran dehydrogenase subunit E
MALTEALARSASLHHHLCPRQVLGARIGLEAGRLFALALPQADKRLVAFVETDGCFADGLAAATGCWFGRRTLRLVDYGKVAATIVDTPTQRAIRLWPHPAARQRALVAGADQPTSWLAQLLGYQRLPASDLLRTQTVTLIGSLAALLGRPGQRVICGDCGEEVMNGRELWRAGQPFCPACVGTPYYRAGCTEADAPWLAPHGAGSSITPASDRPVSPHGLGGMR